MSYATEVQEWLDGDKATIPSECFVGLLHDYSQILNEKRGLENKVQELKVAIRLAKHALDSVPVRGEPWIRISWNEQLRAMNSINDLALDTSPTPE